jgi:RNA polymerase sigma-70 factor (ECF subfamily)
MSTAGIAVTILPFAPTSRAASRDDGDALIARLQRGEAVALGEAYDAHASAVLAFARRYLGDPALAEDLLHEVFVTLPTAIRSFQRQSSLRTFLVSIAINHGRHFVRAAARRRAAMDRFARDVEEHDGAPDRDLQLDLSRALAAALDELPDDQRAAFVLCEVEERSAREASEIVGAPEATVRTRVFHARKKLREALERRGLR